MDEQASADYQLRKELEQILLTRPDIASRCGSGPPLFVGVLDVGSGPLSVVGKVWPTCPNIIINTTLDPLAFEYRRLLLSFKVTPPFFVYGTAEHLPFASVAFPLVHARNSIDHAQDPVLALREMLRVSQWCVTLNHYRNEGWHGSYWGWHNWNFDVDYQRHLILWGRDGSRVDITRYLAGVADVHVTVAYQGGKPDTLMEGIRNREIIFAIIIKREPMPLGT